MPQQAPWEKDPIVKAPWENDPIVAGDETLSPEESAAIEREADIAIARKQTSEHMAAAELATRQAGLAGVGEKAARAVDFFGGIRKVGDIVGGFAEDIIQGRLQPSTTGRTTPDLQATGRALGITPPEAVRNRRQTPFETGVVQGAKSLPTIVAGAPAGPAGLAITMGGTAFSDTGDPVEAAKAAALGAVLPGVGQAAKNMAGKVLAETVKLGYVDAKNTVLQRSIEAAAELAGISAFNEVSRLPEYASMTPEQRSEALQESLGANLAFLPMVIPGLRSGKPTATQLTLEAEAAKARAANAPLTAAAIEQTAATEPLSGSPITVGPPVKADPLPPTRPPEPVAPTVEAAPRTEPARTTPEPSPSNAPPTSTKNAVVEAERADRGVSQILSEAKQSNPETVALAERAIADNPNKPQEVIDQILSGDRAVTPEGEAVLLLEKVRLLNERDAQAERASDPTLSLEERAVARQNWETLESQNTRLDMATRASGTQAGRLLQFRQRLMRRDFTFEAMERRARVAKEGPLTPEESAKIKEQADKIAELQTKVDELSKAGEEKASAAGVDEAIRESTIDPRILAQAERVVKRWEAEADIAWESLQKKLARTSAGVDPTILIEATKIARAKIARAGLEFAEFSTLMVEKFGDAIKPYLQKAWEGAQKQIDASGKTRGPISKEAAQKRSATRQASTQEKIKAGTPLTELRSNVQSIAQDLVKSGVTGREALIDAVHKILVDADPSITRRQAMDLISGYGDFKPLSQDEAKVQLRDLKGQMQQLAKLEDIAAGGEPKKTGVERRKPSAAESALIKQVNEARKAAGGSQTDALASVKKRLQNQITELERRIAEGDFSKKPTKTYDLSKDPEAIRLLAEQQRVKDEYAAARASDELRNRTALQKAYGNTKEALGLVRNFLTAYDMGATFLQAGFYSTGRPVMAAKAMGASLKAAASERGAREIEAQIRSRPNAPLYEESGLYLSKLGETSLNAMEEQVMSRIAQKIPGLRASNRAYTTFLNRVRADSFDAMLHAFTRGGAATPQQTRAIARFVNIATGRGNLGMFESAASDLATVFFSPRLAVSRFQLISTALKGFSQPGEGSLRMRKAIATEYARTLGGMIVVYGLAKLAGGEVEDDPRSSDFGKIKIGNTRLNPTFGLAQATTFLSRLGTGRLAPLEREKTIEVNRAKVVGDFLRNKLAPIPGALWDTTEILQGQEPPRGHPQTMFETSGEWPFVGGVAGNLMVPISMREIASIMEEHGHAKGAIIQILSMLGMNAQQYDEEEIKRRRPTRPSRQTSPRPQP